MNAKKPRRVLFGAFRERFAALGLIRSPYGLAAQVLVRDREQSQLASAFHFARQLVLLATAQAAHAGRDDASAFREERLEGLDVFIVNDQVDRWARTTTAKNFTASIAIRFVVGCALSSAASAAFHFTGTGSFD